MSLFLLENLHGCVYESCLRELTTYPGELTRGITTAGEKYVRTSLVVDTRFFMEGFDIATCMYILGSC